MGFSDYIHARNNSLQEAILNHPFVTGIGRGTLDVEKFKYFIRQDYLFLTEYSRTLLLAAAKAPTLEVMGRFAALANSTLGTEIALHRDYSARFGIRGKELEETRPAPTTQGYVNFLLRTAYDGSFAQLACALLPCMWGYCEIGMNLRSQGMPVGQPLYVEWIAMYSSEEFQNLAQWLRQIVDGLAKGATKAERQHMETAYGTSTRYEYAFWDMAWNLEEWKG